MTVASGPGSMTGKVALVMGAARKPGIGRATCMLLARAGADVVCADNIVETGVPNAGSDTTFVTRSEVDAVAAEVRAHGRQALTVALDADDDGSVAAAISSTVDELGRLDVLCHLGGGTSPDRDGPLMSIDRAAWDVTIARNLTSVWVLNRAAAEQMIRQGDGGAIVNLGSFAAVRIGQGPAAFTAAKAGAEALTKLFALELAPHGIRVNMVHPLGVDAGGGVDNPGLARAAEAVGLSVDEWLRRHVPFGRFQQPSEVAEVVAFLASDAASFVSGQAVSVAGGAIS
jgi:NAD(P)-dependent dehydrogenase (short-subunit alcohol dehydrogenase family)